MARTEQSGTGTEHADAELVREAISDLFDAQKGGPRGRGYHDKVADIEKVKEAREKLESSLEDDGLRADGGPEQTDTEHVVTVESTRVFRGAVEPAESEFLTLDGTRRDILVREYNRQGVPMGFHEEAKRTYECSCGQRFRKGKTAREHLENNCSLRTGSDQS